MPHYAGKIVIVDKMTYAADFRNVSDYIVDGRAQLIVGDICDESIVDRAMKGVNLVIHAAAESHVDNSFENSTLFTRSNVLGTHVLLEAARRHRIRRFVHVSTDEVYGEVLSGAADETAILAPTNPYSASKAAAEMVALGYVKSFRFPLLIIRGNNVFGPRQYPEKLIPRTIMSILRGKRLPLHGNGRNRRHFISARDMAAAITFVAEHGLDYEVYNIGSEAEFENIEVVRRICSFIGADLDSSIEFVEDRPFNDRRYAINSDKLKKLGFEPKRDFDTELRLTVDWYQHHGDRYAL
jgi:dTDP-glucose 4,6-dehydratase